MRKTIFKLKRHIMGIQLKGTKRGDLISRLKELPPHCKEAVVIRHQLKFLTTEQLRSSYAQKHTSQ